MTAVGDGTTQESRTARPTPDDGHDAAGVTRELARAAVRLMNGPSAPRGAARVERLAAEALSRLADGRDESAVPRRAGAAPSGASHESLAATVLSIATSGETPLADAEARLAAICIGAASGESAEVIARASAVGYGLAGVLRRCVARSRPDLEGVWDLTLAAGVLGGACTAALLATDEEDALVRAIGISVSMANGASALDGSLGAARAAASLSAANGALAARLAVDGYSASVDALGGHHGWLPAFLGDRWSGDEILREFEESCA